METIDTLDSQKKERKPVSPFLILGLILLCSLLASALICGGAFLVLQNPGSFPILAGPTEDIVDEVSADPAWRLSLEDDFENNIHGWGMGSSEEDTVKLTQTMDNGKYTWDFHAASGWNFWDWPNTEKFDDFVAAVELQHTIGPRPDSYGIAFRISDEDMYYFEVNDSGSFGVWLFFQDDYKSLLGGSRAFVVRPGEINTLAVKAVGAKFSFYINQQLVGEVEDNTLSEGQVGILLGPKGSIQNSTGPVGTPDNTQKQVEWQQSTFVIENLRIWTSKDSQRASVNFSLLDPQPGYLVYMSSLNKNGEIYSSDTKGTNPVNLTKNLASDYSPEWSPDGEQIAFVSERNGNPEIYLMNRDGSGVIRLTDRPGSDLSPAWSPDGKKIVFSSNRNTRYNLYILDIKTGAIDRLTNGEHDIFPDWSPDGRLIIFQSTRKGSQAIYTIDVNTREEARISVNSVTSVARPVWSPDGRSYLHESKVATNKIGIVISEYLGALFETVIGPGYTNLWPAWSPNGGQIVFVSYRNGDSDIYIVSRDGKLLYRVTNDDAVEGMVDWTAE